MPEPAMPTDSAPDPLSASPDVEWVKASRAKILRGMGRSSTLSLNLPVGAAGNESITVGPTGDVYRIEWSICDRTARSTAEFNTIVNGVNAVSVGAAAAVVDGDAVGVRVDLPVFSTTSSSRSLERAACVSALTDLWDVARRLRAALGLSLGLASAGEPAVAGAVRDWARLERKVNRLVRGYVGVAPDGPLPVDGAGDLVVEFNDAGPTARVTVVPVPRTGRPIVPDGSCSVRLLRRGDRAVLRFHAALAAISEDNADLALAEAASTTAGVVTCRVIVVDPLEDGEDDHGQRSDPAAGGGRLMVAVADIDAAVLDAERFSHNVWAVASLAGWARRDMERDFV